MDMLTQSRCPYLWTVCCTAVYTCTQTKTHSQLIIAQYHYNQQRTHTHRFTHTHTALLMRMLPFSHFNQLMYSESSHRRSPTSNASTQSSTRIHIHKHICVLTLALPHLYPLAAEVDYSRLWLSGSGSRLDDFSDVVTLKSHNRR